MGNSNIFEELITNLSMNFTKLPELLSEAADVSQKGRMPQRLVILAGGFARKLDSAQVNGQLLKNGCERLYARSFYEAGLIYAFDHGLDYEEWAELYRECEAISEEKEKAPGYVRQTYFPGGKITLTQLKNYVASESGADLCTEHLTRWMESRLKTQESTEDYREFVRANLEKFSSVREKARYYFCKYLLFYIEERCERYYRSCEKSERLRRQYGNQLDVDERGRQEKAALEELTFLKPLTRLRRDAGKLKNAMTPAEKKEYLENTSLTPGGIFDEFNYFYFGYISAEWMEILFELYGNFEDWPKETRLRIAHSLGLCSLRPSPGERDAAFLKLRKMEKEELLRQEEMEEAGGRSEEMRKKMYQRGRSGEDFFREFITGARDINRSTLIAFLLFIKQNTGLDEENRITLVRLNKILLNCGFSQLRPDQDFDRFVIGFLRSRDPMEILETEVENQVVRGKNFYLYKVYRDAYSHEKELLKYLCLPLDNTEDGS